MTGHPLTPALDKLTEALALCSIPAAQTADPDTLIRDLNEARAAGRASRLAAERDNAVQDRRDARWQLARLRRAIVRRFGDTGLSDAETMQYQAERRAEAERRAVAWKSIAWKRRAKLEQARGEVERLRADLLARLNCLTALLGQPARKTDGGFFRLCQEIDDRHTATVRERDVYGRDADRLRVDHAQATRERDEARADLTRERADVERLTANLETARAEAARLHYHLHGWQP